MDEKFKDNFRLNSVFIGDNTRKAVNQGRADYTPIFLSQLPALIRSERIPLDVALIQTTPPDKDGKMNLEYIEDEPGDIAQKIGRYGSRIVEDGSTIQVGYGSIPNAIVSCLIDYTNNPLIIAQNRKITAINSALQVDLTGQAAAESLGHSFYSGIGGQADFMREAALASDGKTILALPSTAQGRGPDAFSRGQLVSRIVPLLRDGAGVTLTRGDIHYVVTEYGIAYLHGKSIRERAMDLITIYLSSWTFGRSSPPLFQRFEMRKLQHPSVAFPALASLANRHTENS